MNFTFRGLMVPVFTPFKENMTINLDIINDYAKFLSKSGLNGILVNGTTGEGPSLSKSERLEVAEEWRAATLNTKQHLMVQIGGAPLCDVVELAKHAERIGVDSLLCLPELYFKPQTTSQLIDYLKIISDAAPNTPLLYYHIPQFTEVKIHMGDFMNDICDKVPTFCGIKFTSTCLDEGLLAIQANNRKYAVFLGADHILAGGFTLGFDSAIATSLNLVPQLSFNILNATTNSLIKRARDEQMKLNEAIEIITKRGSWVPTMKAAMNLLTPLNMGKVRQPLSQLTLEHIKEMEEKLKLLNL
ncbi:hypothetical protein WA026_011271 [Henosepilachna vigintioctopunctata]|uniref:N-acetylneuraminate lyase n=1 Tax=Henosepilachna vigintioctopunctata TaxID=420089 RepID=A0AAW1U7N1_9CUCU